MNHLSTAFLITFVIVVNQRSGVTAQNDYNVDQLAAEAKNRAVTIINGPKYVEQPNPPPSKVEPAPPKVGHPPTNVSIQLNIRQPEQRPPSKPPITPDKTRNQNYYANVPRYYGHIQKIPPRHYPNQQLYHSPNSVYKFPRVIPLPPHLKHHYYAKSRPLVFAASTGKPTYVKSPKFSLPVQTINGIRTDFVRPPKFFNTTTTTTTTSTEATTTTKVPRTKRIWPIRVTEKQNSTLHNTTVTNDNSTHTNTSNEIDYDTTASTFQRIRSIHRNGTTSTTTAQPSTTRGYRPVTRKLKVKSTTTPTINFTALGPNDWVPMVPSHYPKLSKPSPTPINKRSDIVDHSEAPHGKQMLYLQSFGLVPVPQNSSPNMARKKMVFFKRKRQLNPYYSGYSPKPVRAPSHYTYGDLQTEGSHHISSRPRIVTKIKHHHHHHHHKYIKTVEKPVKVPYKVEVPKPYPVHVEKKVPYPVEKIKVVERPVPYPVTVEKKVPYPIGIKIPVPVKVIEKEYIPKPYPIIHHVPVVKHVQVKVPHPVPVTVEKKVPYPVEVKVQVPVDRPVPVPYEKRVPYPVPVKVLVPQPYPVETKVPYPVQVKVKEPVEVIKHVPVNVPYPQPYPVKVPVPVEVEKRVPYPVEVEKKVPVPVEVRVPQRIEVEKRVPVYVPKPYPVEKKVPVPVKVPYPVKVPVKVPVEVPVEVPVYIHHPYQVSSDDHYVTGSISVTDHEHVTSLPQHTVTVHGNTGFAGFQSRSDKPDSDTISTTIAPNS